MKENEMTGACGSNGRERKQEGKSVGNRPLVIRIPKLDDNIKMDLI